MRIGVIGYGYWGPNIVRNFHSLDNSEVVLVADRNPKCESRLKKTFPAIGFTTDENQILTAPDIDVVAVVTPVWTHFELAKKALENGKHVFVEKPFTYSVAQGEELVELAARKNLKIMVDHTFLFTGAVRKIKELVDKKELGDLYYYDALRVNLGLFQHDVNVIWDLAPHDLSIMDYVIGEKPEAVVATGERHLNGVEDVAFITVYFPKHIIAHVNVNWLSPVKVRTTLIGGEKKMLVWNDLEADEKLRIYDKGVSMSTNPSNLHQLLVSYRSGDMWAPQVEQVEALRAETAYFIKCIEENTKPFNDGEAGLRVVRILEAADRSIRSRGEAISL
ncbi:MAG TPA: Gfo/Idh/MocA family oxidoreductase [Candidatus Limnocylindrales bacterium]|jgi:predicted dehydrogenase|nr:Gfo/Idh/MocA family oxidoreductase [Candidatus Limnocylindrales bacterium]